MKLVSMHYPRESNSNLTFLVTVYNIIPYTSFVSVSEAVLYVDKFQSVCSCLLRYDLFRSDNFVNMKSYHP